MASYQVTWQIDIEAPSPKAAALEALRIQRKPDSWATVFTVESDSGCEQIDLGYNSSREVA